MNRLVHIPYSPWSRRVRVALDYMEIPIACVTFTPTLSEPWLRLQLGNWLGRFTLPVLLPDDGEPLMDGLDIVTWASAQSARPLLTDANHEAVAAVSEQAERLMVAGRLLTTQAVLSTPQALQESLPPPINRLGPIGRLLGRDAARRLMRKYPDGADAPARLAAMREVLLDWRERLAQGEHVLDAPSYADLCVAFALDFVRPAPNTPVGPTARDCWTRTALAEEFSDVLAWRDRLVCPAATDCDDARVATS